MSKEDKQNTQTEKMDQKPTKLTPADSQTEPAKPSREKGESMRIKPAKSSKMTLAGKIGVILIIPGALALAYSIVADSQVMAFIGLGLTFWGALFFLVQPSKLVRGSLLDATAAASYSTIDRMMSNLNYKGECWYIPPYPKQAYLPEHLKGLKEMIIFIAAEENTGLPSIEEIANKRFILRNPKGLSITAPGARLLDQLEEETKLDPTQTDLQTLCETLPQQILENFQLAKEIEMTPENSTVKLKITGSVFRTLYTEEDLKSLQRLGCPLISALACAVAKTTGKAVTIKELNFNQETDTAEASLSLRKD
ncbi:MAG TPA: hypothetical protein VK487_02865 [Candidatus Bathyarchaeia archaeon]|nr:hypothetical protein [Candidatus Bathyarchaeia archaeon]